MAPTGTLHPANFTTSLPDNYITLSGPEDLIADASAAVRVRHEPDTPFAEHRAQAMRELRSINRHERKRRR